VIEKNPSFNLKPEATANMTGHTAFGAMLSMNMDTESIETQCLRENGYEMIQTLCPTIQGQLLEARPLDGSANVVIKRVDKELHRQRISSKENGMNIVVEESIIKETILLHHLTVDNKPTSQYVVRFIQFFESDRYFYLVMEKAGTLNLSEFNARAHRYIKDNKMKIREWRKIVKFLLWQLSVIVYWLHRDMNCCHLDLTAENIMLQNAKFIENEQDGTVSVDPDIRIRLCDFGLAEVFDVEAVPKGGDPEDEYALNPFKCTKHGMKEKHYLSAPRVFEEEAFDARKADIWSLGIILFEMATGNEPFQCQDDSDEHWALVKGHKFIDLLAAHDKVKFMNQPMLRLLTNLLNVDEQDRVDCTELLENEWMKLYYSKYKTSILKKTKNQMIKNKKQRERRPDFPYYKCNH